MDSAQDQEECETGQQEPAMGNCASAPPASAAKYAARKRGKLVIATQEMSTWDLHARGTIVGNCVGDAVGLSTEFMSKQEAEDIYSKCRGKLEYKHREEDRHRCRWVEGDWTDDSDQMLLILQSLVEHNGQAKPEDFGVKLKHWARHGFEELGDTGGCGLGSTTAAVLRHPSFETDPLNASHYVWSEIYKKQAAPNGGVMRTGAVGLYRHRNINDVIHNTLQMCRVTHTDPRCQASCVAVTVAIATMMNHFQDGVSELSNDMIGSITEKALSYATRILRQTSAEFGIDSEVVEGHAKELSDAIKVTDLASLELGDAPKIGYTYKTLGAGFWALKQSSFRDAIEAITFEAGDADTNCAVAGALLGCKLGQDRIPTSWLTGLAHGGWLEGRIQQYLQLVKSHEETPEKS